jgi:hypothetical protein
MGQVREHKDEPAVAAEHATAAWRENLILEAYYGQTLRQSRHQLRPQQRVGLERANVPTLPFESKAGAHLITRFSEAGLLLALLGILAVLVVADLAVGRRTSRAPAPPP